jgi:hypothetical protein
MTVRKNETEDRKERGRGVANSFRGRTYERGKWGGENSQSHKLDNNYLPSVCYFLFGFPVTECVTARNVESIFEMKYLLAQVQPKKSSFNLRSIREKLVCFSCFT